MPMMTSQILKSVDFTKPQKSSYLENKTLFFLQIKKFINYTLKATLCQKYFCSGGPFKLKSEIGGSHNKLKWVVFSKQGEGNLFFLYGSRENYFGPVDRQNNNPKF